MKAHAIIKAGTKEDPIWLYIGYEAMFEMVLKEDDDNLPWLQPFPELIDKEELAELGGELVELEITIVS
jgi:hypothetical protein